LIVKKWKCSFVVVVIAFVAFVAFISLSRAFW